MVLTWTLAVLLTTPVTASAIAPPDRLAARVLEIRAADYRGDRDPLRTLARELEAEKDGALDAQRHYWAGFALWRRALNGFNLTPLPEDLQPDLRAAVVHFRQALVARPGWIEAKVGIVGCSGNLLFLTRDADPAVRQEILAESVPMLRELEASGTTNPRALWIVGGMRLGAPPPYGGDTAKAAAVLRQGVEAAVAEARAGGIPALEPSWGGAENLMMLAVVHSRGDLLNPALAEAYAQGALVSAPEWTYVREILVPRIAATTPARP